MTLCHSHNSVSNTEIIPQCYDNVSWEGNFNKQNSIVILSLCAIGIGAQYTFGHGQDIYVGKYVYEKLAKCPNFTLYLPKNFSGILFGGREEGKFP